MWFIIARRCDIHSSFLLFFFSLLLLSCACISLCMSLTVFLFVCFCFMCHVFFVFDYLLIHRMYTYFIQKSAFYSIAFYFCVSLFVSEYPCFISNYFTINFQMHFYNARFTWTSFYCFSCQWHIQTHCLSARFFVRCVVDNCKNDSTSQIMVSDLIIYDACSVE